MHLVFAEEYKERLDKIGSTLLGNPHFDSYELVKDITIVGVAVYGFTYLATQAVSMVVENQDAIHEVVSMGKSAMPGNLF